MLGGQRWFFDKQKMNRMGSYGRLHRSNATNAKNPINYPRKSNHEPHSLKHTFIFSIPLLTNAINNIIVITLASFKIQLLYFIKIELK